MAGGKHGAWCHIEIPASNLEAAKKFYGGLFGWKFTPVPEMNYTLYSPGEGEIGGGLFDPPPNVPRMITNYVNVDSLEASAKKVVELGGRLVTEKMDVPGHGSFRVFTDPEGNALCLWESIHQPEPARKPAATRKAPAKAKKR